MESLSLRWYCDHLRSWGNYCTSSYVPWCNESWHAFTSCYFGSNLSQGMLIRFLVIAISEQYRLHEYNKFHPQSLLSLRLYRVHLFQIIYKNIVIVLTRIRLTTGLYLNDYNITIQKYSIFGD